MAVALVASLCLRGQYDLTIGQFAGANSLATSYTMVDDCRSGQTPSNGTSCDITVRFGPLNVGSCPDSFDIPSSNGGKPSVTVTVFGAATEPTAAIPALDAKSLTFFVILSAILGVIAIRRQLG